MKDTQLEAFPSCVIVSSQNDVYYLFFIIVFQFLFCQFIFLLFLYLRNLCKKMNPWGVL